MSHEFTLPIELEHKDFCNGCPCLDVTYYACRAFKQNLALGNVRLTEKEVYEVIRPDRCKQNDEVQNG